MPTKMPCRTDNPDTQLKIMARFAFEEHVPEVSFSAWTAESSQVIGMVRLDDGASVWPGAVLRGDIESITVGAGSNVQDNAVIHTEKGFPCVVEENVTVGHSAVLHGCTVKKGALIGMGAVVLNGAVVEENAVVGAGSLVAPGKVVAAGTLAIGTPARFVRNLTEEEIRTVHRNTEHYVEQSARFAKGLRRID